MKFFKIFKLLTRDAKSFIRRTAGPLAFMFGAIILLIGALCVALNGIGWIIFKIAGENSVLSLKMFEEGIPTFLSFQYVGVTMIFLILLSFLILIVSSIKKTIVKMKNYFVRLFKEV